jgi:hypothetical protein
MTRSPHAAASTRSSPYEEVPMRVILSGSIALLLFAAVAGAGLPEPMARTGDRSLDRTLQSINAEAKASPSDFWSAVSKLHGVPEPDLQAASQSSGLGAADIYMASAISHITQRPFATVVEVCSQNREKGWGAIAKEMGIKPGSPEFHRLKADASGSLSHLKAAKKSRQQHEKAKLAQERKAKQGSQGKGGGKSY